MTAHRPPLRTIVSVLPQAGFRLAVVWAGGMVATIDFASEIASGGVFALLKGPGVFEGVRLGSRKRTVEWRVPDDKGDDLLIDVDADALAAMVLPAQASTGAPAPRRGAVRRARVGSLKRHA